MKHKFLLLATAILTLTFYSCQKEITGENTVAVLEPIPTPTAPKNLIDQIFMIDSLVGFPTNDTIRTVNYVYDSLQRVSAILQYFEYSPSPNVKPEKATFYFYSGNDTIPNKSLAIFNLSLSSGLYDSTITFHSYDNNKRRILDSTSYSGSSVPYTYIDRYSYGTNEVYIQSYDRSNLNSIKYDIVETDSRANAIFVTGISNSLSFGLFHDFDNNPSPFAQLSNFKALKIKLELGDFFYHFLLKNTNNILKVSEGILPGGVVPRAIYAYNYLSNGYPSRSIFNESTGVFEIIQYKYKIP